MNCRKVNHLLSAYMDGELPGVEHRQIHTHLGRCPECAEEYAGLLRTKRLLATLRVRNPRSEVSALILKRLAEERERAENRRPSALFQQGWLWLRLSASPQRLTLGAGLALIGIVFTGQMLGSSDTVAQGDRIHFSPIDTVREAFLPPLPSSTESQTGSLAPPSPFRLRGISMIHNTRDGFPQRPEERFPLTGAPLYMQPVTYNPRIPLNFQPGR